MAPRASSKRREAGMPSSTIRATGSGPQEPSFQFPEISQKYLKDLKVEELLEDQIVVVQDVLSAKEVSTFLNFFESLPMVHSPPPRRGEALRTSDRFATISPEFAAHLYMRTAIGSLVDSWPSVVNARRRPQGLHENIRVYSYRKGELFGPHYDQSSPSPVNPSFSSEWTLLIYLSSDSTPLRGGATVFHLPGKKGGSVSVEPRAGMALLHRHGSGRECLIHEGEAVVSGQKWVLRSDVLFGPSSAA